MIKVARSVTACQGMKMLVATNLLIHRETEQVFPTLTNLLRSICMHQIAAGFFKAWVYIIRIRMSRIFGFYYHRTVRIEGM